LKNIENNLSKINFFGQSAKFRCFFKNIKQGENVITQDQSDNHQDSMNPSDALVAWQKNESAKTSRRNALRKIGKYSAYALPALLAMSARAARASAI
jgi:hypothetical protein